MSVNSVVTRLPQPYGPLVGNNPQNAKPNSRIREQPGEAFTTAALDEPRDTSNSVAGANTASSQNLTGVGPLQDILEQSLRPGGAAPGHTVSAEAETTAGRASAGIALYQRVSEYANSEPSASALLKRWNEIMQPGQGTGGAVAAFANTLSRHEAFGSDTGILDLKA